MESVIEWQKVLLGEESIDFLVEVVIRSVIMFVFILIALRASGKRGIKQLSIFELVIIIGLGSAAGDPMFYKEVGIIPAIVVFTIVIGLYRLVTWLSVKFIYFENLVEGSPLYLVREGKFSIQDFDKEDFSQDEFFAEMRLCNVEHLGQVKNAIMETSGSISLLYFPDSEVRPGLPLYPDMYKKKSKEINFSGIHACAHCGNTQLISSPTQCDVCGKGEWVIALNTKRIS